MIRLTDEQWERIRDAPVASAEMIFTGIPLAKAAIAPSVPAI
jgi:hypothetical protein